MSPARHSPRTLRVLLLRPHSAVQVHRTYPSGLEEVIGCRAFVFEGRLCPWGLHTVATSPPASRGFFFQCLMIGPHCGLSACRLARYLSARHDLSAGITGWRHLPAAPLAMIGSRRPGASGRKDSAGRADGSRADVLNVAGTNFSGCSGWCSRRHGHPVLIARERSDQEAGRAGNAIRTGPIVGSLVPFRFQRRPTEDIAGTAGSWRLRLVSGVYVCCVRMGGGWGSLRISCWATLHCPALSPAGASSS